MSAAPFLRTLDDEVKKMAAIQSRILLGKTLCCIWLGIYVSSNNKWLCFLLLYAISLARSHHRDIFLCTLAFNEIAFGIGERPKAKSDRYVHNLIMPVGRGSLYVCQKGNVCRIEPTEDCGVSKGTIEYWDFYFRAPGSLVVLSFLQPLNFSSVFPSL
jgi:hypothetical protein